MPKPTIKALCFDVFGTTTDWYGSTVKEGEALCAGRDIKIPWGEFVKKWRIDGYLAAMFDIASGKAPYMSTEQIHRIKLLELLNEYNLTDLSEDEIVHFNLAWDRIIAWPDVVSGLGMLKEDFMIMPLSNGDYRSLLDISKNNKLPWDGIISAEFFDKVKPDPAVYTGAVEMLSLQPAEVLMVACHARDLDAARECGLQTAYVNRPLEYGPNFPQEPKPIPYDFDADSFIELAQMLREDKEMANG